MKKYFVFIFLILSVSAFGQQDSIFKFAFFTDIHLQPEKNAPTGFRKAIDSVNNLGADFVIFGGDNIRDALGQDYERTELQFNLLDSMLKFFNMPVYITMGNHDIFGLYENSGVNEEHPDFGKKYFEKRIGERYYSFDHKNYHFVILDGIGFKKHSRKYYGYIDEEQIEWLKSDLEKTGKDKPVIASIHIPLMTVFGQVIGGSLNPNDSGYAIVNSGKVIEIFREYNVKLVLQGHLHYNEDIFVYGTHYLTSGAICGKWWSGSNMNIEEGFTLITVDGESVKWDYIDYGWEVNQ